MCIHCEEYSRENKYCDDCLAIRLLEIMKENAPGEPEFVYDLWMRILKLNYWALQEFLEKYDTV